MLAASIFGLPVPDAGPVFIAALAVHITAALTAVVSGFYVDNGPALPVWEHLPHAAYWLLPAAVGVPLIWRALRRFNGPAQPPT